MVEVRYQGGLGNNMFQYCLGRLLAEDLGFALRAQPIPEFPNTGQAVQGARYDAPEQIVAGQRIDIAAILADRGPRKIVLDGWFQRLEYYREHLSRIREWLAFGPSVALPEGPADVAVHVRRTDYVGRRWTVPFSFYNAALERLKPRPGCVWIVTDDAKDPYFRRFRGWKPKFLSGAPGEDMLFLTRARNLVLSPSTFSWWAAILGAQEQVICPDAAFGAWSKLGASDGEVDLIDRDRFVCLTCDAPDTPTPRERQYQLRRYLQFRAVRALRNRLGLPLRERSR